MLTKFRWTDCKPLLLSFLSMLACVQLLNAQNPIVTENALAGNPRSEWDISGAGDLSIQGFATDISVNKGETVRFKIKSAAAYTIDIYRLGYYNGAGARRWGAGTVTAWPQTQPDPYEDATGIVDCGNWSESANWVVPSNAVSGVYIARLKRTDNNGASHIVFIVRDDASTSPLFFQTSDATWQAYNAYGGNSLYLGSTNLPGGHASKVSYNRPFVTRNGGGGGGPSEDWIFNAEYPMIRFLERNGYHVTYTTNVDAARRGNLILNHKVFLSVGHDEYWSLEQRNNVEAARNAGVHLAFFSGNEVYWKTRWENSKAGTSTSHRTLVCYKEGDTGENVCGGKCDNTSSVWTGLWRTGGNYDAGKPENALTGQISWEGTTGAIQVPADYKNLRFWRNTSVAALGTGQTATFPNGTLGYEWDYEQLGASNPPGRITLSSTTFGGKTHKLSLYRHPSGALVFGAGTVQWAWGLDSIHDRGNGPTNRAMQQATVNLFADMGVQPATLMSTLQAATASTDLTAPQTTIGTPVHGNTYPQNVPLTITGTAVEAGGGVLVGVEISVDGGTTWQLVNGTTNWSYSFTPQVSGTLNIRVRGFDDSGNMEVPGAAGTADNVNITIGNVPVNCPCNVFTPGAGPITPRENDGSSIVLGMKFRATQNGAINGIRYYKAVGTTGLHTGTLWSAAGAKLAEGTFNNETASGWQTLTFNAPYPITANTTYIVSYHSPSGDYVSTNFYFDQAAINGPLRGLANGEDGPNGLYKYSATVTVPTETFSNANYWVDVIYSSSANPDVTPPTVSSVLPLNNATGVLTTANVTATLSEVINPASVNTSNFELRGPGNVLIPATISVSQNQLTLVPTSALANSTVYTATVKGGASGVKDLAGNALAANYSWSFTTVAAPVCPCTIFQPTDVPAILQENDGSAIEVGLKFRSSVNGSITGIRYYKPAGMTGTRTGHLWNSAGGIMATAVFQDESASGWQQVNFASPVNIVAGTTYVVSYFSSSGDYVSTNPYFTQSVTNGPLTALANGVDGPNGLYTYTATGAFPTNNFQTSNYFVDVVFSTTVAPDNTAPLITVVTPGNGTDGNAINKTIRLTFSETVSPASVTAANFELRNAANAVVSTSISVNGNLAVLTPTAALTYSQVYTVRVKGGASGIKDLAGNALAADSTWTFTVVDAPGLAPTEGAGGPILVVSSASNPFSRFPVEMLRAEGLNGFHARDISQVNATLLNSYDVVVLGEIAITAAQASMFSTWVNAGGTLIAFRPSAELSSLMGITKVAGSLTDQYLLINTASGPGAGIVGETIQFHGTADLYTLNGATAIATLYSSVNTATTNPAVTTRSVGSNGGKAVAFTYDLARSIVYTRQGNPAWAGQKRDGTAGPIRSDDMFFGGGAPDWVNLDKVAIPQADEQQRLLTNIIIQGNMHRKPMPRFWFLPDGKKAAVVMTGDDHANNGTEGRFNIHNTQGPNSPQDVKDWKSVRASSYIWLNTPISNATASTLQNQGHEIALHLLTGAGCENYTAASFENDLSTQLAQFATLFPGLSAPVTNRNHCIAWSDWASAAKIEAQYGIRLDVNYYYWPAAWVQNRSGMFTGSGMPMRFADLDGSLIDCYQVATQLTDESGLNYTQFTNELLDRAVGAEGYYGVFCANMHTDSAQHIGATSIINSAQARGVPVISAKQMLTWLDGRNNSSFGSMTWANNTLSFSINVRNAAYKLKTMLPFYAANGQLTTLTRNGSAIPFTVETIKGLQYAFFDAPAGNFNYVATYAADVIAPVISNIVAVPNADNTATITWTTNEGSDSRVDYGVTAGILNLNSVNAAQVTSHTITLTNLAAGVTYHFRVSSKDGAGNNVTSPAAPVAPLTFTMPASPCFTDILAGEFSAGTPDAGVVVAEEGDGQVMLKPSFMDEFAGAALDPVWGGSVFSPGGSTTISGGAVVLNGTHIYSPGTFGPGTSLEFEAKFDLGNFQSVGFSIDQAFDGSPWVLIGQGPADGQVYARAAGGTHLSLGNLVGTTHRYRIQWNAANFEFYIDDAATPALTVPVQIASPMYLQISDFAAGDGNLTLNWIRVSPHASTGTFTSRIYDAGSVKNWVAGSWTASVPATTGLAISVRTGNTPTPDASWTAYTTLATQGAAINQTARYIQYKADLTSADASLSPRLKGVALTCSDPVTPPVVTVQPTPQSVCVGANASFTSNATGSPAPMVQWQSSPDGTNWTNIAGATGSTYSFTTVSGDNNRRFRAVWANGGGTVNSTAVLLTVNALPATPTVSASGATTFCAGGSVTLTSSAGTSYLWSNGATTQSIVVTTAGNYTVRVTNANNCQSAASAVRTIVVNARPSLTSPLTTTATSDAAFTYTPVSSIAGSTFTWSRAAVSGISNSAASGTGSVNETLVNTTGSAKTVTYVYTVTSNGCTNTANVVVTVDPPATVCGSTSSLVSSFNSSTIPAGRYIWFNSVFDPSTLPSSGVVNFYVTNSVITFTANSQQYTINVPNAHIRFASNISNSTTQFLNNTWETMAPLSATGNIFLTGHAYQVPVSLPGSISNVTWTATIRSDRAGVSSVWKWSAATYSSFAANASIQVKSRDGLLTTSYLNLDNAGAPQNFKAQLVSGARGTGGTNYTGTYTSTLTTSCAAGGANRGGTEYVQTVIDAPVDNKTEVRQDVPFNVTAMPNPSRGYFNLVINGSNKLPVTVRIVDVTGQVIEKHERINANTVLRVGDRWKTGAYVAEIWQGTERKVVKLLKAD